MAMFLAGLFSVSVSIYYRISLNSTFFNLHCSQLAIASRGEQWLDVYYKREQVEKATVVNYVLQTNRYTND